MQREDQSSRFYKITVVQTNPFEYKFPLCFYRLAVCAMPLNATEGLCLTTVSWNFVGVKGHMRFLIMDCGSTCCVFVLRVPVCVCTRVWAWLPPTHQIAKEKDNSPTWPWCLSLSYAPGCVWASPAASRTTSPLRLSHIPSLSQKAHRSHPAGRYTDPSLHTW